MIYDARSANSRISFPLRTGHSLAQVSGLLCHGRSTRYIHMTDTFGGLVHGSDLQKYLSFDIVHGFTIVVEMDTQTPVLCYFVSYKWNAQPPPALETQKADIQQYLAAFYRPNIKPLTRRRQPEARALNNACG